MDPLLERLVDLLDVEDAESVGTSVRLPTALRDAAVLAAELGYVGSTTELTVRGLREVLESLVQRAVLDAHYQRFPGARPDLAEIALVAAELDGHPLAARPDLVRRAAVEIILITEDPSPDEVLSYAAGLAAAV
ncbi:MAG: hypothetical protein H0V92_02670 [Pseudonocardiales bacterium]|nr:hypothetical protein [Pseudonocardiales bacterium]